MLAEAMGPDIARSALQEIVLHIDDYQRSLSRTELARPDVRGFFQRYRIRTEVSPAPPGNTRKRITTCRSSWAPSPMRGSLRLPSELPEGRSYMSRTCISTGRPSEVVNSESNQSV